MYDVLLITLFILLILIECFGDLAFHYSITQRKYKTIKLWIGLLLYLLMGYVYYNILKKYDNLAVPNALYQGLSVVAVTLLSLIILKEQISRQKVIGICIVILGLLCVQLG